MVSGARLKKTQRSSCMKQQSQWIKGKIWVSALYTSWTALLTHQVKKEGVSQSTWYSVVASRVAVPQIFTLFTIFLSTWQLPPALVLCSGSPLLPFFFQLPSYSLIICAGWPDQSWHCHSPSQSLTQSFLLPAFCSLPPTGLKLLTKKKQKKIFSLHLECGHWVCQLLSLRILLLIFFLLPH